MLTIKVPLKNAQKIKIFLLKNDLFDKRYSYTKDNNYIYFPVKKRFKTSYEFVEKKLVEKNKVDIKKEIRKKLTKEEIKKLKTSFDVIGDIAIIEVEPELEKKEKIIAKLIMAKNPKIKTVLKKKGAHYGDFRIQKTKFVLGENKKVAEYKENNVKMIVDIDNVYFSPRSANERKRICSLVNKGEEILVMFSGIAPFPCVISKNTDAKKIVGIELNPRAHELAKINVKMNKLSNIELINDDVRKIIPKLNKKFDRILMPLPKTGKEFLPLALKVAKKGTIIHLYNFLREDEFKNEKKRVLKICEENKAKCKVLRIVKAGQPSPRTFRVCIDIEILEI